MFVDWVMNGSVEWGAGNQEWIFGLRCFFNVDLLLLHLLEPVQCCNTMTAFTCKRQQAEMLLVEQLTFMQGRG